MYTPTHDGNYDAEERYLPNEHWLSLDGLVKDGNEAHPTPNTIAEM